MSAITFLASLLAMPVPVWFVLLAMLGLFAALHLTLGRRLDSHARSLGHMDRWADSVEARLDEIAPERPQGLFAPPGRSAHFLTAANDASVAEQDMRRLSDRDIKDVLSRITRSNQAA